MATTTQGAWSLITMDFTESDLDQEFALGPGILPRFDTEAARR